MKRFDAVDDLSFGLTGQYHLRSFVRHRQDGAGSRRIEADRTSNFRVPKISGIIAIDWAHPPSLHGAYETILAFDCCFVAMPSEDQDLGIAGYGRRSRTPRQGDLSISIRHQVLVERGHARIRCFGVLCLRWPPRAQHDSQHESCLNVIVLSYPFSSLIAPVSFTSISASQPFDVDLGHLHHGLKTLCDFTGSLSCISSIKALGDDLPRHAKFVVSAMRIALPFRPQVSLLPQTHPLPLASCNATKKEIAGVNLYSGPPFSAMNSLPLELEGHHHHGSFRSRPRFAVTGNVQDFRVLENGSVEGWPPLRPGHRTTRRE